MSAVVVAPAPETLALDVRNLKAGYQQTTVLRDVSLEVAAGSAVALLGPNGAGKSTLLRAVSGLLPAKHGRISFYGIDITRRPAYTRFRDGMCHIPEGRGVFRSLTVRENLVLQAKKGSEQEVLERAIAAFPILGQRLEQRTGTLSGGQQQMLALSAAHARNPRLILVDEASLGLAPLIVDEIFAFLATVKGGGTALLVVDQFVSRALAIADRIYLLNRGAVTHAGTPADLADTDIFASYLGQS